VLCARAKGQSSSSRHLVGPHDENLYRLARKFILDSLKQVVIPLQNKFIVIVLSGRRSEVDLSDLSAATRMASNGHVEMLPFACRFTSAVGLDTDAVAQRPSRKNVVPGSNGEHRDIDVTEVFFN
jgi:hypothetical protein